MTPETRPRKWRWLLHTAWVGAVIVLISAGAIAIFFGSGAANPFLRRLAVRKIEAMTGARVEMRGLSINWRSLTVTVNGLVVHGKEPADTEPLFAAEQIQAGLRVDSFWGRKFSLSNLVIQQPRVHIRVEKDGTNNVPAPPRHSKKPLRETLFDLHVQHFKLVDGWVLYNDIRKPLALEGDGLQLALDAGGPPERTMYLGKLDWQSVQLARGRDVPLPLSVSANFTVSREGFTIEQAVLSAERSHLDFHAEMPSFANPSWTFRYRGWSDLRDFRLIMRAPQVPGGRVDFRGEGAYGGGKFQVTGTYSGADIDLEFPEFHDRRISSRGSYTFDNQGMVIPDFEARAFGGRVTGRVTIRFADQFFRAQTHVEGVRISELFPAIEHRGFPIDELHWDASLNADTVETWNGTFSHFDISGDTHWTAPDSLAPGHVPVNAAWKFRYRHDLRLFEIASSAFDSPSTHITAAGRLSRHDTQMDVHVETTSLESFDDFIHAIAGARPASREAGTFIGGSVQFDGKITGALAGPTFAGRVRGENVRYGNLQLDALQGDLTYSPSGLAFTRGLARRGATQATVDVQLALSKWSFLPDDEWSADAGFEKAPLDDLQGLAGWKYPVHGSLSGDFHGRGTRAQPSLTGLFDLAGGDVYGVTFNRLRGQLNVTPDEARISNAELRIFPPGKENSRGAGIVTGSAGYNFTEGTVSADLVGAALPLENFQSLQSAKFPLGGQLTFRLRASGPAKAPQGEGSFRVVDLRIGQQVMGSFEGILRSDGHQARLDLSSAMANGKLSGGYTLGLEPPYPLHGKVDITDINLEPFLASALKLSHFDGHAAADGEIALDGSLNEPSKIVADARLTRLVLDYAKMRLENAGPVHFRTSQEQLDIEPATLRGPDTDIQFSGNVRFAPPHTLNLKLKGAANLRLLSGFLPSLDAQGPAQVDATITGATDSPRITGRAHVEKASARTGDFPVGLSDIQGDLTFDATRLFFENVHAQLGGGTLTLTGSVNYADQPVRYDITARTDQARIRYPEGMSWLLGGSLRLTGTPAGGLLAGRVTVHRVILGQGLESLGPLFGSGTEGVDAGGANGFLQNLRLDIQTVSSPDARMEWPNAQLEADSDLRLRGTVQHPIMLGHIHVLSGDLNFRGNRYRVSRGDINFANPFQLNPQINVEATTTIQQYEVTLDFTGLASALSFSYRSDPPLPGNDIITLLTLGQTTADSELRGGGATGSQSNTSGATALLSEAVSSQLGDRLQRLFGITHFRVDPGLTTLGSAGGEQNAAARVTVEQQVTRELTITYVSNVGTTQAQVIQVEYNINRNISIVALRDYNGTFGIDVKIKKRFP
jgi:translocation and assembly module TamB